MAEAQVETAEVVKTEAAEQMEALRWVMRSTALSVSLVTTVDAEGGFHGLAVTTANSLSFDPMSMMVAVNRSASAAPVLDASRKFCINILAEGQDEHLANFSRSDARDKRFAGDDWQIGPEGLPYLRGSLASVFCAGEHAHAYGSHVVWFGRVTGIIAAGQSAAPAPQPMVWQQGRVVPLAR